MQTLKSWASKWPTQIITNSLFQFDCLILISAFTFGYYNIENSQKKIVQYLVTRYIKYAQCRNLFASNSEYFTLVLLRLSILILFMIVITLMTPMFLVRGPLTQDFLPKQTQSCQANGWINLLFVQNYYNTDVIDSSFNSTISFKRIFEFLVS